MTKPKIVCVVGSGLLTPILVAIYLIVCTIFGHYLGIYKLMPDSWWLLVPLAIGSLVWLVYFCRQVYRWLFKKCYAPSAKPHMGSKEDAGIWVYNEACECQFCKGEAAHRARSQANRLVKQTKGD